MELYLSKNNFIIMNHIAKVLSENMNCSYPICSTGVVYHKQKSDRVH